MKFFHRLNLYNAYYDFVKNHKDFIDRSSGDFLIPIFFNPLYEVESLSSILFLVLSLSKEISDDEIFILLSHIERTLILDKYKSPFINKTNNKEILIEQIVEVVLSGYFKMSKKYIPQELMDDSFFQPEEILSLTYYKKEYPSTNDLYKLCVKNKTSPLEACLLFLFYVDNEIDTELKFKEELRALQKYLQSPTMYLHLKYSKDAPDPSYYDRSITHQFFTNIEDYDKLIQNVKVFYIFHKIQFHKIRFTEL